MMNERQPNWERTIPRGQSWGGCRVCEHYQPGDRCAAYPDRIPLAIYSGEIDHLVERPYQVGDFVFKVVEHPTAAQRLRLQGAAARGAGWAIKALSRIPVAATSRAEQVAD